MLRIHYSNRIERLVDALVDAMPDEHAPPLALTHIVVPNAQVATYLQYGIAARAGVCANVDFPFLDRFLTGCIPRGADIEILDRPRLHALLCAVLDDADALAGDDMAPVRGYLDAAGGDDDERDLRRFQLAGRLATLFIDYGLSRPQWKRGPEGAGAAWQQRLWRAAGDALERLRDGGGPRWLTLPQLFEHVRVGDLQRQLPTRVHLFGFSHVAQAHYRIFERIARATDLRIYALNPCREYWQDLQLEAHGECPPLRLWGKPGRDHHHALSTLTDGDFDESYADPADDRATALARLQSDVLHMRPEREAPPCDLGDAGVRVLACPGMRREAEVIADEIWRLIEADSSLRFSDIAVLVNDADRAAYQTHITAAFRATRDIPCSVLDLSLASHSRVVEAVDLLLGLPFGSFGRRDLLRLLTHPAVTSRYPDVDADDWLRWADALAIVHGADRDDHRDTYIEGDRFNWDQGIRRLALGAFMAGARSGETRAFSCGDDEYLPEEIPSDLQPSAARFALLARSLIADARTCRETRLPLAAWSQLIGQLVSSYLHAADDDDEHDLARCMRQVEALSQLDLDGRPVSYRIASQLVRGGLTGLRTRRGDYLSEGVVVAAHLPMRPIPFRVVFVTGLGEGRFPAAERDDPLDLRAEQRRRGDVTPRERDRYLFLETLLSARDRLVLSYVARDEQTGERLQPSSVVHELTDLLARGYTSEPLEQRFPLRRYDDDGAVAPEASRERRARALRDDLVAHLGGAPFPTVDELRAELPPARWDALRAALGLPPPPPPATAPRTETIPISIYTLREFLKCPLQASASFLLGLRRDDDDDVFEREDEPFSTAPMPEVRLLRDVFLAALAEGDGADVTRLYDERARRLELEGATPSGLFRAIDRDRHLAILRSWRANLGDEPGRYEVIRFGRAEESSDVDELRPPLVLELDDGRRVEIHGKTDPVRADGAASLALLRRDKIYDGDRIRGYVDQAVLAAAEIAGPGAFTAVIDPAFEPAETRRPRSAHTLWPASTADAPPDLAVPVRPALPTALSTRRFAHMTADEARAWLRRLAGELLAQVHDYLLPCEAVLEYVEKHDRRRPFAELIAARIGKRYGGFGSRFGPVRHIDRFDPPDDADELIDRRFGRFFAGAEEDAP